MLHALAGLVADKSLDSDLRALLLGDLLDVLRNTLLAVLSLDVDLVQKDDLLQFLVDTALDHALDDLLRLLSFLRIVHDLSKKDFLLMCDVIS